MGAIKKKSFGNVAANTAGREVSHKRTDKDAPKDPQGNVITKAAKINKSATLVNEQGKIARAKGELPGGVQGDAFVQGPSLRVSGSASARATSFKSVELAVSLNVDAKALKAGASITKTFDFVVDGEKYSVKVKLGPEAYVGANGNLNLKFNVGPTGVRVRLGASGFAGARGALTGTVDVAMNGKKLVSSTAKVTFAAGVGAGASLDVGPGRFHATAYAVAGVGVGFEMKGSVNAKNLITSLPEFLPEPLERKVDAAIEDVKETGERLVDDAKDAGGRVVDAGERAVDVAQDGFEDARAAGGRAVARGRRVVDSAFDQAKRLNPFD